MISFFATHKLVRFALHNIINMCIKQPRLQKGE